MKTKRLVFIACAFGFALFVWQFHRGAVGFQSQGVGAGRLDIREFVRLVHIHGVPYEEAIKYDASVVPILVEMLADRKEEPYWPNIVVTLGMIGAPDTEKHLIEFLTRGGGPISDSHYRAKSSVPTALGYVINKNGSEAALAYLKQSLNPSIWNRRQLRWTTRLHQNNEERNIQLSTMAILGLALSGNPSAWESLQSLQKPAVTEEGKKFQSRVSEVTALALRDHQIIAKEGLLNYYRKSKRPEGSPQPSVSEPTKPPGSEPIKLITGKPKPPPIVTGAKRQPPLPNAATSTPKLPPAPNLSAPLQIPKPYKTGAPPISTGSPESTEKPKASPEP
jgi:hypothetical protein